MLKWFADSLGFLIKVLLFNCATQCLYSRIIIFCTNIIGSTVYSATSDKGFAFTGFQCAGSELSLLNCTHQYGHHRCGRGMQAAVSCQGLWMHLIVACVLKYYQFCVCLSQFHQTAPMAMSS